MLYLDNTYISSFEDLKKIIVSNVKFSDSSSEKFCIDLIETFETGDLQDFLVALQTKEAMAYWEYLNKQLDSWYSLASSEKFNTLIVYFTNSPFKLDVSQYFEIISSMLLDNHIVIEIVVCKKANEWISLELIYLNKNSEVVCADTFEKIESLARPVGTHLFINLVLRERSDVTQIIVNCKEKQIFRKSFDAKSLFKDCVFDVECVSFRMIYVKGGMFSMGADDGTETERPVHEVELSDFYMAETLVTQALWQCVLGRTIDDQRIMLGVSGIYQYGQGDNYPMYHINYEDCLRFVEILNEKLHNQLNGMHFDIPTEAQWEYAARGGIYQHYFGSKDYVFYNNLDHNADNYLEPLEVKTNNPNTLGLYDICGNILEWCKDYYDPEYYKVSHKLKDPQGPYFSLLGRVVRGGKYSRWWTDCSRVARRAFNSNPYHNTPPKDLYSEYGFRLVLY